LLPLPLIFLRMRYLIFFLALTFEFIVFYLLLRFCGKYFCSNLLNLYSTSLCHSLVFFSLTQQIQHCALASLPANWRGRFRRSYYLPAALPAFLRNTSPANFTPLPLYGSGLRKLLIFAAT